MSAPRSVLIMAGGTGGHVFPALAAANCLRQQGVHVEWLGTEKGIESRLVPEAGITLNLINISGARGKGLISLIKLPLQLCGAIWQSITVIRRLQPVAVLGLGGFVAGPGGIAAWLCGRPLLIHEQNAVAGTTNRLLARFSQRVLTGYPIDFGGDKNHFIGNPVRPEISALAEPAERWAARDGQPLRVLVLGGSLGAKAINDVLPATLAALDEKQRPEVWHQTGKQHIDDVSEAYKALSVDARVEAFIDDMAAAYGWADMVICRAGALTVAELTAAGVGALLIPLPHAIDDHQTENARWLAASGAGQLMPQSTVTVSVLKTLIRKWSTDRGALLTMAESARAEAKHDAAAVLAAHCLESL